MTKQQKIFLVIFIILLAILGVIVTKNYLVKPKYPTAVTIADPSNLPGLQTTEAPWAPETEQLRARLLAIHFPILADEGTAVHIHTHLDIFIDGKHITIPTDVGDNNTEDFTTSVHTEASDGVIHVEAPNVQTFTLGQFFDVWGVKLTTDCIGGYCVNGDKTLMVFVNGQKYMGNPRDLALAEHQEIAIAYGTPNELRNPVPSTYTFEAGE